MYEKLFIGNKIIKLDEVDSTNNFMQKQIAVNKNEIEGLVVIAKNQISGKGLGGNVWESEKDKNLTFSILLKPNSLIQNQFLISKTCCLGVMDFLNNLGLNNVKIKWPNDIYVADKKIAGILIENSVRSNKIYQSIIGIGLNVNQTNFSIYSNNPTSIAIEIGNQILELDELLDQLLFFIEKRYLLLKRAKVELINNEYTKNLYWLNESRNFISKKGKIKGTIIGTNSIGKLKLIVLNKIEEFDLKELEFDF